MKKLSLFLIIGMFSFISFAQDGMHIAINAGVPVGNTANRLSFNASGNIGFLWGVSDNFSAGVIAGYSRYFAKEENNLGQNINGIDFAYLPIAASARFNISDIFRAGGDLGYAIGLEPDNVDGGIYYAPRIHYIVSEKIDLVFTYKGIVINNDTATTRNASTSLDAITLGVEIGF